jgi:hypothetical protein
MHQFLFFLPSEPQYFSKKNPSVFNWNAYTFQAFAILSLLCLPESVLRQTKKDILGCVRYANPDEYSKDSSTISAASVLSTVTTQNILIAQMAAQV